MNFGPDPNTVFPLESYKNLVFLKNIVKNPNIIIGDYIYYDDFENPENFLKNVKYHFDFMGDQLIIGKFCMIASDVEFLMNGANHLTNAISAYPFAIFGKGWEHAMDEKTYPTKGNIKIGNDVWIGYKATILPGVQIGDGAIIGSCAVVTKNVEPYSIVAGNPAKTIRKRFDDEKIKTLLKLRWWDWNIEKITANVSSLTSNSLKDIV